MLQKKLICYLMTLCLACGLACPAALAAEVEAEASPASITTEPAPITEETATEKPSAEKEPTLQESATENPVEVSVVLDNAEDKSIIEEPSAQDHQESLAEEQLNQEKLPADKMPEKNLNLYSPAEDEEAFAELAASPVISVSVPGSVSARVNPYRVRVTAYDNLGQEFVTDEQIIQSPQTIYNYSEVPVTVSAAATGTYIGTYSGTGDALTFVNSSFTPGDNRARKAFLYVELKQNSSTQWSTSYDALGANKAVVVEPGKEGVTPKSEELLTMTKYGTTNSELQFRLRGQVNEYAVPAWTKTDKFRVDVTFTFESAAQTQDKLDELPVQLAPIQPVPGLDELPEEAENPVEAPTEPPVFNAPAVDAPVEDNAIDDGIIDDGVTDEPVVDTPDENPTVNTSKPSENENLSKDESSKKPEESENSGESGGNTSNPSDKDEAVAELPVEEPDVSKHPENLDTLDDLNTLDDLTVSDEPLDTDENEPEESSNLQSIDVQSVEVQAASAAPEEVLPEEDVSPDTDETPDTDEVSGSITNMDINTNTGKIDNNINIKNTNINNINAEPEDDAEPEDTDKSDDMTTLEESATSDNTESAEPEESGDESAEESDDGDDNVLFRKKFTLADDESLEDTEDEVSGEELMNGDITPPEMESEAEISDSDMEE